MQIAYFIGIHKDFAQFRRLFECLHNPQDLFLIHVDRKAPPALHADVAMLLGNHSNASVLQPSLDIVWGGWAQVEQHLRALRHFLESAPAWDYFINLSGQCFPLCTPNEIRSRLAAQPGRNFFELHDLQEHWPPGMRRVHYWWVRIPGLPIRRPVRIPFLRRKYLPGVRPFHGSNWFILSRPFADWLVHSPDVAPFRRFYRHSVCCDEGFYQTAFMHSPFRDTLVPDNLRAIRWEGRSSPATLTCADLDSLCASDKLFARKFDPAVDARVLEILAERLQARSNQGNGLPRAAR